MSSYAQVTGSNIIMSFPHDDYGNRTWNTILNPSDIIGLKKGEYKDIDCEEATNITRWNITNGVGNYVPLQGDEIINSNVWAVVRGSTGENVKRQGLKILNEINSLISQFIQLDFYLGKLPMMHALCANISETLPNP